MSVVGKTIRVFISSTFSDLIAERDALQQRVFPSLRTKCEARGWRFVPIDLRWGIGASAAYEQKTIEICRDEILRSQELSPKPNFLVLTGNRYGWVPLPDRFAMEEGQAILQVAGDQDCRLFDAWYALDQNADPAEWRLQRRTGRYRDQAIWSQEVESPLREAIGRLAAAAGFPPERMDELHRSATEVEIVEGILGKNADPLSCTVLMRCNDADLGDEPERLEQLRERLCSLVPEENIARYDLADGIEVFATLAKELLEAQIDRRIAEYREDLTPPPQRSPVKLVEREEVLERVAGHLAADAAPCMLISGMAGSGRTEVMEATFARHFGSSARMHLLRLGVRPELQDWRRSLAELGVPLEYRLSRMQGLRHFFNQVATGRHKVWLWIDDIERGDRELVRGLLNGRIPEHLRIVASARAGSWVDDLCRSHPNVVTLSLAPLSMDGASQMARQELASIGRRLQPGQWDWADQFWRNSRTPLTVRLAVDRLADVRSGDQPADLLAGAESGVVRVLGEIIASNEFDPLLVRRTMDLLALAEDGLSEDELLAALARCDDVMAAIASNAHYELPGDAGGRAIVPTALWSRLRSVLEPFLALRSKHEVVLLDLAFGSLAEGQLAALPEPEGRQLHRAIADVLTAQAGIGSNYSPRALEWLAHHLLRAGAIDRAEDLLTSPAFIGAAVDAGFADQAGSALEELAGIRPTASVLDTLALVQQAHMADSGADWPPSRYLLQLALEGNRDDPTTANWSDHARRSGIIGLLAETGGEGAIVAGRRRPINAPAEQVFRITDALLAIIDARGHLSVCDLATGAQTALAGHSSRVKGALAAGVQMLFSWSDNEIVCWSPSTASVRWRLDDGVAPVDGLATTGTGLVAWSKTGTIALVDGQTGSLIEEWTVHGEISQVAALKGGTIVIETPDALIAVERGASARKLAGFSWSDALEICFASDEYCIVGQGSKLLTFSAGGEELSPGFGVFNGKPVFVVALSDDAFVVGEFLSRQAQLWRLHNGNPIKTGAFDALADMPLGAAKGNSGLVAIWSHDEVVTHEVLFHREDDNGSVLFSDTTQTCCRFDLHHAPICGVVALSGELFASWSTDGSVYVWQGRTGAVQAQYTGHRTGFDDLAALDDKHLIAWSSLNPEIALFDIRSPASQVAAPVARPSALPDIFKVVAETTCVLAYGDGTIVVRRSSDDVIEVVAASGRPVRQICTNDRDRALAVAWNSRALLIDLEAGEVTHLDHLHLDALSRVASLGSELFARWQPRSGTLHVHRFADGLQVADYDLPLPLIDGVCASPGGEILVWGGNLAIILADPCKNAPSGLSGLLQRFKGQRVWQAPGPISTAFANGTSGFYALTREGEIVELRSGLAVAKERGAIDGPPVFVEADGRHPLVIDGNGKVWAITDAGLEPRAPKFDGDAAGWSLTRAFAPGLTAFWRPDELVLAGPGEELRFETREGMVAWHDKAIAFAVGKVVHLFIATADGFVPRGGWQAPGPMAAIAGVGTEGVTCLLSSGAIVHVAHRCLPEWSDGPVSPATNGKGSNA